ncbi:hypothetical protein IC757_12265 [Wenzhouxiangella sp. AB-CW3]|uniref:hypothetical protein n=1 Tax=Wenzhouxiangella sp. AB-CW3 TaxID=2771012 RepID=UPI00168AD89B|nr:hypothetical protein [Wenzhouxiangella sp. AB-CW3]QOC21804.1 hypothetical protein IC757_12265 [Wenzhouxiangella sp. AB-CW3]
MLPNMKAEGTSDSSVTVFWGLLALLCFSLPAPLSAAQQIKVGSDQACDTTSLTDAINAVDDGGTVLVANNQSYDGIEITIDMKSLTIAGGFPTCSSSTPSGRTTLGRDTSRAINTRFGTSTHELNLINLEITGASGSGDGAGIRLGNRTHLTLENVLIHGNETTGRGGGVFMNGPIGQRVSIDDPGTEIFDNQASKGGGIYCEESAGTIRSGVIELNAGLIQGNRATEDGGGIYLEDCNLTLRTGEREGNTVSAGIYDNEAEGDGGGLYVSGSSEVLLEPALQVNYQPLIDSNRVSGLGGGVYCTNLDDDRPEFIMTAGLIRANRAWWGGGMWLRGCDVEVYASGSEQGIQDNVAEDRAEDPGPQSPRAGGIGAVSGTVLEIDGGNRDYSPPEQSIHIVGNSVLDGGFGGAIASENSATEVRLRDVRLEGNSARSSPALRAGNSSKLSVDHSEDGQCTMPNGPDGCSQILANAQSEVPNAFIGGMAVTVGLGAQVKVSRTVIRDNQGSLASSVFYIQNNSDSVIPTLHVNSSLIVNNKVRRLLRNSRNGEVRIAWTTVANNVSSAPSNPGELIWIAGSSTNTAPLDLVSSIIWQPGDEFSDYFRVDDTAEVDQVNCLITHDPDAVTAVANSAIQVDGNDPRFGAPSNKDWTVSMSSPAFQCSGAFYNDELDLAGRQRGVLTTLPGNPVIFTAGAYSIRSTDTLFMDRFEF